MSIENKPGFQIIKTVEGETIIIKLIERMFQSASIELEKEERAQLQEVLNENIDEEIIIIDLSELQHLSDIGTNLLIQYLKRRGDLKTIFVSPKDEKISDKLKQYGFSEIMLTTQTLAIALNTLLVE